MSSTSISKRPANPPDHDRQTLVVRLEEAGIPPDRMVDLPDGGKQNNHDHTDPENQHHIEDVTGTYGVACGDGLVVIDIDPHCDSYTGLPDVIKTLPATLTVKTPHDGEHRYYAMDGDSAGTRFPGVDVQGNGQYVVGPGSTLDSCTKKDHDCSLPREGRYHILDNRTIAELDSETTRRLFQASTKKEDNFTPPDVPPIGDDRPLGLAIAGLDTEYSALSVYLRMKNAENGDKTLKLIRGSYRLAGYQNDRSRAEAALVEELGWWYQDDLDIVWTIMDWICQLNPQTDTGEPRKWLTRGEQWKKTLFPAWFGNRDTYDPNQIEHTDGGRPAVSKPTKKFVMEAIHELGEARMEEIVVHPRVDRGKRQVQRACKQLQEEGVLVWRRRGRKTYYSLTEPS